LLLFKVQETFLVKGKGLLLSSNSKTSLKGVDFRSELRLVLPTNAIISTSVVGINWENGDLIVSGLTEKDVPKGTEVWLEEINV
jgi:hypothetical protein